MGRTPAQLGTLPVTRYHTNLLGVWRNGRRAATSVDDFFMWYHQNDIGSFDVASLARMSLASVRHWRSHTPFCLGTCGDMVVRRMPFWRRKSRICCEVKSPALSVCMRLSVTRCEMQNATYFCVALNASDLRASRYGMLSVK
eukprot:5393372-Pleurochrysis_carterae.AAC.1